MEPAANRFLRSQVSALKVEELYHVGTEGAHEIWRTPLSSTLRMLQRLQFPAERKMIRTKWRWRLEFGLTAVGEAQAPEAEVEAFQARIIELTRLIDTMSDQVNRWG